MADHAELAKVLAAFGSSRLSFNMNQVAKDLHAGSMAITPGTESELRQASADIAAMRQMLVKALGLESAEPPVGLP